MSPRKRRKHKTLMTLMTNDQMTTCERCIASGGDVFYLYICILSAPCHRRCIRGCLPTHQHLRAEEKSFAWRHKKLSLAMQPEPHDKGLIFKQ